MQSSGSDRVPRKRWMVGNATDSHAVTLPKDRPLIYFLTATDERGAMVSTEHEMLAERTKRTNGQNGPS